MNVLAFSSRPFLPPRLLGSPTPRLLSPPRETCNFGRKTKRNTSGLRQCHWNVAGKPAGRPEPEQKEVVEEEEEEGWEVAEEDLEKLEEEAIMGDDQGREPMDYNRRAQIFYKSSQLFQAIKDSVTPPPQGP